MNRLYSFLYPIVRGFLKIFFPWECSGAEHFPEGGALICGNHTALGDPLYVVCSLRKDQQMHVMAKAEIMKWPLIGFVLRKAGVFGVKRGKSDVTAIKEAMRRLNDREKRILRLRFFEGRTQMEVAGEIGISQAQVSRLEKGAINTIKKHI